MRRLLTIYFFLALCHYGLAQAFMRELPELKFANLGDNRIDFYGDSTDFEHFFDKMDSLLFFGEGEINIMHIGGSHVQAGVFTQLLRDNLLNLGEDLNKGIGTAFPFSVGNTNNPSGYYVSSNRKWSYCRNAKAFDKRLGISGAAITTNDAAATVNIVTRECFDSGIGHDFFFNKITLTGYSDCDSLPTTPIICSHNDTVFPVIDIDGRTYNYTLNHLSDSMMIMFDTLCGNFTITGLWLNNDTPIGLTCHGIGVNGARVSSYLYCEDFADDLDKIRPDLVIFGIGINDAAASDFSKSAFMSDYANLIDIIKDKYPNCALLFITNNDSFRKIKRNNYRVNPNGAIAQQAFIEMGKLHNAGVWDQFHIMGGLGSMKEWQNNKLAQADKVHFTSKGYALLGDMLYNAIIDKYANHLRHKPITPL